MYHQVRVRAEDQSALRFVWRVPGSLEPPQTFQMTVHIFGAVSSPTTCMHALQKTAIDNQVEFEDVAAKVRNNFYVDNFLDSVATEEDAIKVAHRMTELLLRGGFKLTKWLSSSRKVIETIPAAERNNPLLNLDFERLPSERTLGLIWECERDTFKFQICVPSESLTKRKVLSAVSSIYDPLGFLNPYVLGAKVLLQQIWRTGCGWDETLPQEIHEQWARWAGQLALVNAVEIPRCLRRAEHPIGTQLHVFTDASSQGFGAVAYLRHVYEGANVSLHLVISKTRVAPVKPLSIPRLELQGAIVGLRLAQLCCDELRLPLQNTVFWTDSQTVLQWIHATTFRFQVFVANRIGEILEATKNTQWHHVSGKENPADDCTRVSNKFLKMPSKWIDGPSFLKSADLKIPRFSPSKFTKEALTEIAENIWVGAINTSHSFVHALMSKTSRIEKLKRVVAFVSRFVKATRKRFIAPSMTLEVDELDDALTLCIIAAQRDCFSDEIKCIENGKPITSSSRLIGFNPFIDESGVLRVGGRLERSCLTRDERNPILLSSDNRLTTLVIEEAHRRTFHASTERTLHEVRGRFWILKGRVSVKKVVKQCVICKLKNAQPATPEMAPLPPSRITPFQPPFTFTGIDYFGPLIVSVRRSTEKRWGVLFTCLTTRAVHIELATSLDTDSFLMSFRRFLARRHTPAVCYSDNGTNLTSGERELRAGVEALNKDKMSSFWAAKRAKWKFSPPSAPHFGGAWESLVKSAKTALIRVLGRQTVKEEVLQTVLIEIEALLNGRPLTHISVDPRDPEPLTPNHFLVGHAHPNIPPDVIEPGEETSKRRWRVSQALVNQFWQRWLREYLPYLAQRKKWTATKRNMQIGDVVLIIDNQAPRGYWPVGIITKVWPGPDGVVRTASVKTKVGEYTRPVVKLCLLETAETEQDETPRLQN